MSSLVAAGMAAFVANVPSCVKADLETNEISERRGSRSRQSEVGFQSTRTDFSYNASQLSDKINVIRLSCSTTPAAAAEQVPMSGSET